MKGRYTAMWEKQFQAEQAAEEARDATARANKLLRQAHLGGNQHSEDNSDGYNSMSSSTVLQTGSSTPGAASITKSEASSDDEGNSVATDKTLPK